ncbi:MAG: hypothetical protein GTO40_08365 [Deltaproteobacteria bacterium]|nr:hypothetical protein [Deltaproteobacteria bacterium]
MVDEADREVIQKHSGSSQIVFLPFQIYGGRFYHPFGGEVANILPKLPMVVLSLAAQDVDLDAEPEEGTQAEVASTLDQLEEAEKELAKLEAESDSAAKLVVKLDTELSELLKEGAESDLITQKRMELEKSQETAQETMRQVERALAAKEAAAKEAEDITTETKSDGKGDDSEK